MLPFFALPLALDSLVVAALIGAAGVSRALCWRLTALFTTFEGGMPLIGLAAGVPLARAIGGAADYIAAAMLLALGGWMQFGGDDMEEKAAVRLLSARGLSLVGLAITIGLDELAIGFSLGLARLPITGVVITIAVQAFLAAQLGMALGARIGERLRENAERFAALALIALGSFTLVERLTAWALR
ncbi:hypothetical protein DN069_21555 [Streptacidiphilus pinicola]|uniref:Manganese efflux pump MntP n=1 Tax=Streptacidiphilus pinicola TaxID=2219663 RepID=A0A2X0K8R8_9ACTN|nr:manganese efflux pump [Streptacidiphilus pinicola]RAG83580.1 hypothetical protein DN069_21555 [Streptacidiphilus pinicola]